MSDGGGAPGTIDSRLTRLSPSLWWYRDTCNVYLWTAGDHGLLVDLGSGGILDALPAIGVREIEAVVHTHHHRDQCGGDVTIGDTPCGELAETLLEVLPG